MDGGELEVQPASAIAKPSGYSSVGSEGSISERTEVSRDGRACGQPIQMLGPVWLQPASSLFRITVTIAIGVACSLRGLCPRRWPGGP